MGYAQIIPRSCFRVITLSAQRMSLCTESQDWFGFFFLLVLPRALLYIYLLCISTLPLSCSVSGGLSATPPINPIFTTLGQFSIANKLLKAPLEYNIRLQEAQHSLETPVGLTAGMLCSACICFQLLMALERAYERRRLGVHFCHKSNVCAIGFHSSS